VVDDASNDGTLARAHASGVEVIANEVNRGFAAAVNQGIREIRADFILLLNPDAVLKTGIEAMCEVCAAREVGVVGGKLVDSTGAVQAGFNIRRLPTPTALAFEALLLNRIWPRNPANWHYRCYGFNYDEPAKVEQPAGALMMFRREVWVELGGFDEQFYPVWFEDVDFCQRLRDHGYWGYYEPLVIAVHQGGHSIRKILLEKRQFYWYGSLLKYCFKHYQLGCARVICLAVIAGSLFRMVMGIAYQQSAKPLGIYGRVIRLSCRYLLYGPDKAGAS